MSYKAVVHVLSFFELLTLPDLPIVQLVEKDTAAAANCAGIFAQLGTLAVQK